MMRWAKMIVVVAGVLAAAACSNDDDGQGGGGPPAMMGGGDQESSVTVETVDVDRGEFQVTGDYAGEFRSEGMTELSSDVAGRIMSIEVNIGDTVDQGQLLARIDDTSLHQSVRELEANVSVARANREEAQVNRENLESDLRRKQPLLERDMVSEREIEELESAIRIADQQISVAEANIEQNQARLASAREDLSNTEVRAPFDGKIGMRHVDRGTYVSPGQSMFTLIDDGDLYVTVKVPERQAARVNLDTPVTIRVGAVGSVAIPGQIHRIAPAIDPSTRTLRVDVTVDNGMDLQLRPGMYGRLRLELGREEDALTVSNQAILRDTDGTPYVWKVEDGKAQRQDLELGLSGRNRSQIVGGLTDDDRVVLRGHEKLEEGSNIRDLRAPDGDGETS